MNLRAVALTLSVLLATVLASAGFMTMFSPFMMAEAAEFGAATDYAITNVRTLGAPTLALALAMLMGAWKREWMLILPGSAYFLLNCTARVISVIQEGYSEIMLPGLLITGFLFILSQVALHIFRLAPREAEATA